MRNAQNASFDGVIVYNKLSNELEIMSAADDSDIFIPSVFVGKSAGNIILGDYLYTNGNAPLGPRDNQFNYFVLGFALVLNDDFPFNINTHLIIPFCIVVGLCFVIMVSQANVSLVCTSSMLYLSSWASWLHDVFVNVDELCAIVFQQVP